MPTYKVTLYLGDVTISMPVQAPNEEEAQDQLNEWFRSLARFLEQEGRATEILDTYPMDVEEQDG